LVNGTNELPANVFCLAYSYIHSLNTATYAKKQCVKGVECLKTQYIHDLVLLNKDPLSCRV